MSIIPRGHISTILLGCLVDGDKYGAQLFTELQNDNEITIKQPTLYSTLSRMEKQGLISSYWRDSDIGGKRHYYSLTDLGKKTLKDAENIILAEKSSKKYDENEGFQNESAQLDTTSNSSYFENAKNSEKTSFFENEQSTAAEISKDDGRFSYEMVSVIKTPLSIISASGWSSWFSKAADFVIFFSVVVGI